MVLTVVVYVKSEGPPATTRPLTGAGAPVRITPARAHAVAPAAIAGGAAQALITDYCVKCHNGKSRATTLSLLDINLENLAEHAPVWEQVLTKLHLRAMPPPGGPRPDDATYEKVIAEIESAIDTAAAAAPIPGRPLTRRLTRVEYTNAIRDLLGFEFDGESMLPADHAGHGFDNMGEVLSVSPLLMERYLFAAERISRLAIGDPKSGPATETYHVSGRRMQDDRVSEELPFGSRGGTVVSHLFPADGEYVIRVLLQRNDDGYIRGLQEQHQLDVLLDGAPLQRFPIGGEVRGRSGPIWTGRQTVEFAGDLAQTDYEFTADEALQTRVKTTAGTKAVGVVFVKRRVQRTGVLEPPIVFDDLMHYKGGEPAVESVTIEGPYNPTGISETLSRRQIFICHPATPKEESPCATKILGQLAHRAYRRPVEASELEDLRKLYEAGFRDGGFEAGIQSALQGILAGPEFLFRLERSPAASGNGPYRISDLDLASHLSFLLWSSIPDAELLGLAEHKKLSQPEVLEQQVARMIRDSRSDALLSNFAGQWLSLRNLDAVEPSGNQFPDFDDELRDAMRKETELLFGSIVHENRSIVDLLTADYTFVNERLARHYGIPNVSGSRFRRVQLADENRRGLLGQGSFLTVSSYANRTSPVLRGKWILQEILDMAPPPPPPDVPTLEVTNKDNGKRLTMREALVQHQSNPACSTCHKLMDPIGFALENFDAVGAYRTLDLTSQPIQADGVLFDGKKFDGIVDFRRVLLSHKERFVHTATSKLLTYALGRPLDHVDAPVVRKIMRDAAPGGYRWSDLLLGVIRSAPFQMRSRSAS
jgi:hypothetical protein